MQEYTFTRTDTGEKITLTLEGIKERFKAWLPNNVHAINTFDFKELVGLFITTDLRGVIDDLKQQYETFTLLLELKDILDEFKVGYNGR